MALSGRGDEQGAVLAVVRLRPGVVGETRRVCHLVAVPGADERPEYLVALCGERVFPGEFDVLREFSGMPCERCVANSLPADSHPLLAAGG